MANKHSRVYYMELEDGRLLEVNKNSSNAWIVRVNNDIVPNVYEVSHIKAIEKAKQILGVE